MQEIARPLPYHSGVDTQVVIEGINRLIADEDNGQQVFFDIYPEVQRRDRPDQDDTGLFFFRGKPGALFAVLAPMGVVAEWRLEA